MERKPAGLSCCRWTILQPKKLSVSAMGQGASPVLYLLWVRLNKSKINKDRKRGDATSHTAFLAILSSAIEVKHWNNCQERRYLLIPALSHGLPSKAVFIRPGSFQESSHKSHWDQLGCYTNLPDHHMRWRPHLSLQIRVPTFSNLPIPPQSLPALHPCLSRHRSL